MRRARQEVRQPEFLDITEVAGQFLRAVAERGYGHDILPQTLPDVGSSADSDEIFSRLFGPAETDRKYLLPYLASLARFEWKQMDPRMRDLLSAKDKKAIENGRLPSMMITRVLDREMGLPRQRLAIKARARIYWQVFEKTRTRVTAGRLGNETENDAFKRRMAVETADFEEANFIATHALEIWSALNDNERLVFGDNFDIIERGLPEPFFVAMLHLKDELAKMDTRYAVAHVRALLNDFAKLTNEQRQEMRIAVSPRTGKPQINTRYLVEWHEENDDHDDIDGTGSAGGASQGPASLPPAEGSKGGDVSAAAAAVPSAVEGTPSLFGSQDHERKILGLIPSDEGVEAPLAQSPIHATSQGGHNVVRMMFAGASALRRPLTSFATRFSFMPMVLQTRPVM